MNNKPQPMMTITQAARKWGVSKSRVRAYLAAGRIPGATKTLTDAGTYLWKIPADATKPETLPAGNPNWKAGGGNE